MFPSRFTNGAYYVKASYNSRIKYPWKTLMNPRFAVIVLCFSSIGWGLTWLPIKGINQLGLSTPHLILIAFSAAALALLPWVVKQRQRWISELPLMLALAALGGFANVAFQTAIAEGHVIRVMILFYMLPIWSAIGGRIFLKEKIDYRRAIALCLCIGGAFFILEVWHFSFEQFTWVDLLALGSGMGLAASNILFRFTASIPIASKISFMSIGCIVLIGLSLPFLPVETYTDLQQLDVKAIPYAMAYGLVWLLLITFGSQWAVTQIEASRSAVILVLELVAAVISVVLLTSSELALNELFGSLMVLTAALLEGTRSNAEKERSST